MFLSIGMLKLNYFLADIFILSAEKQPIKLSWRKIECLLVYWNLFSVSMKICIMLIGLNVIIFIKLTSKAEKESYNLYKHDKYYIRLKDDEEFSLTSSPFIR